MPKGKEKASTFSRPPQKLCSLFPPLDRWTGYAVSLLSQGLRLSEHQLDRYGLVGRVGGERNVADGNPGRLRQDWATEAARGAGRIFFRLHQQGIYRPWRSGHPPGVVHAIPTFGQLREHPPLAFCHPRLRRSSDWPLRALCSLRCRFLGPLQGRRPLSGVCHWDGNTPSAHLPGRIAAVVGPPY